MSRKYGDRAVALLRQALNDGFHDAAKLKTDPDLLSIRSRNDFEALATEMHAKQNANTK
jgi:hypothetical protein